MINLLIRLLWLFNPWPGMLLFLPLWSCTISVPQKSHRQHPQVAVPSRFLLLAQGLRDFSRSQRVLNLPLALQNRYILWQRPAKLLVWHLACQPQNAAPCLKVFINVIYPRHREGDPCPWLVLQSRSLFYPDRDNQLPSH